MRITIILALLVSLIILLRSGITAWQFAPAPAPEKGEIRPEPVFNDKGTVYMSHTVPEPLPDLDKGYLFNAERSRVVEDTTEPESEDTDETDIDFDTVSYGGSIITNDLRKAIVTYSVVPASRFRSRTGAIRSRTARTARVAANQNKSAQLVIGDTFNGYKVVDIKAEKIIFQRDEEQIEKLLHDPAKQRVILPPSIAGAIKEKQAAVTTPDNRQIPAGPPAEEKQQALPEPAEKAPNEITTRARQPAAVPERRTRNPRQRIRPAPPPAIQDIDK